MAKYFIQDTTLTNLADKIRVLNGTEDTMTATEMADNVQSANSEVDTQSALIDQLNAALEGKAGGGASGSTVETCTGSITVDKWGTTIKMYYLDGDGNVCRQDFIERTSSTITVMKGSFLIIVEYMPDEDPITGITKVYVSPSTGLSNPDYLYLVDADFTVFGR